MRSAAGRPLQSRSEMHHGFAAAIATVTKCLNQVCNLFLMCLIVCVNPMMCSSIHSACCRPAPWSFEWFFLHVFMCFLTWTVHLSLHGGQLVRWLSGLLFSLFNLRSQHLCVAGLLEVGGTGYAVTLATASADLMTKVVQAIFFARPCTTFVSASIAATVAMIVHSLNLEHFHERPH